MDSAKKGPQLIFTQGHRGKGVYRSTTKKDSISHRSKNLKGTGRGVKNWLSLIRKGRKERRANRPRGPFHFWLGKGPLSPDRGRQGGRARCGAFFGEGRAGGV